MPPASDGAATFDAYAESYEQALERGVSLSGEESAYFARGRVRWLGKRLAELGAPARTILDYGCGTGATTPYLLELRGSERVIGVDASERLLEVARREYGSERARFMAAGEALDGSVDLAYCNGVFHHIPVDQRPAALAYVRCALRPEGVFALCENNPWNPGTRLVMRRIPFDRDAVTLSPPASRRMLAAAGFDVLTSDFLFFFPAALRVLRRFEPRLAKLPGGAQYLTLARKPAGPRG